MKVASIFLFIMVSFLVPAAAAPFLISDPYGPDDLQPTSFELTINGKTERVAPQVHPDGRAYLYYDLKELVDGDYTVKVKALNDFKKMESAEEECRFRKKDGVCFPIPNPKEKISPSKIYKGYIR